MAPRYFSFRAILIGLAYFAAAAATMKLTRFDGGVAFLWVASAILIAELTARPPREWPAPVISCTIASYAATTLFGLGPVMGLFLSPALAAEALIAAILIRRLPGHIEEFGSLEAIGGFVAVAGIIAPGVVGLPVAGSIALITGMPFEANWVHWYMAHALGTITFAPILMLALNAKAHGGVLGLARGKYAEAALLTMALIGVCIAVFGQSRLPLLFLPILPMVIGAFRFGRIGAAVSLAILAIVGGILTMHGSGPVHLVAGGTGTQVQFFQFYLAIAVATVLPVAAELKRRQDLFVALRESEARYRLITDGSSDVILNLDRAGLIRYVSPSVVELAGYDAAALIGRDAGQLVLLEDRAAATATHARALAEPGQTCIVEYRALTALGAAIWCESHTRAVTDDSGLVIGAVSQIRNISHHKLVEAELARAALTDPLTGLVNRRVFDEALDRRLDLARSGLGQGVCAILDLDFFKRVNDRYGHAAGDRVLRAFADIATASIREGDLVARLGGEEFGMILWGADIATAHAVCERLRREVADLSVATEHGAEIHFTFSGGLARIVDGLTRAEILREADEAMYRAKGAGRNRLAVAA